MKTIKKNTEYVWLTQRYVIVINLSKTWCHAKNITVILKIILPLKTK
jgi:hypothetical protein